MSDWLYGVRVPPLRIAQLQARAASIRRTLDLGHLDRFPVGEFVEHWMPRLVDDFDFELVDELPNGWEARAFPNGLPDPPHLRTIQLRERVYEDMCSGNGRARQTVLHECGHLLLHSNLNVDPATPCGTRLNPWENSEWQAHQFAAELLMPPSSFRSSDSLDSYCARMGVSRRSAHVRSVQLVRRGSISRPTWLTDQEMTNARKEARP